MSGPWFGVGRVPVKERSSASKPRRRALQSDIDCRIMGPGGAPERSFEMNENKRSSKLISFANTVTCGLALVALAALTNCTNDTNTSLNVAREPSASKAVAHVACTNEDLAPFLKLEATPVEVDKVPEGLFLASVSEMLVEASDDAGSVSRVLYRENAGKSAGRSAAEIICSNGTEKLGTASEIEFVMKGLVKFSPNSAEAPTLRQYFFHADATGIGAVFSNPRSITKAQSLREHLRTSGGQLLKLGETKYALRYVSARDRARASLLILLDYIPN